MSSDTVTVSGAGTVGSPFVMTAAGGGGGGSCVPITTSALIALQTAGTLDTCTTYIVSDWSTPNSLPGPNILYVHAVASDKLSEDVGVYATVNAVDVSTSIYTGPVRGKYIWEGAITGMAVLESVLNNKVVDLLTFGTAGGAIDSWDWGSLFLTDNHVTNVTFTGGYATVHALAAVGNLTINGCRIVEGTINLTGVTGTANIDNSEIITSIITLAGPSSQIRSSKLGRGTRINLTGKTAGSFSATDLHTIQDAGAFTTNTIEYSGQGILDISGLVMLGSTIFIASNATQMTWRNSEMLGQSNVSVASGARGLNLVSTILQSGVVTQNRTGGPTATDTLSLSNILGGFTLAGATDPAGPQLFTGIRLFAGQINITNPTGTANPVNSIHIDNGILNVDAGGAAGIVRLLGGPTLNTGAFTQQQVIIDGVFTKTGTAANVNTLTNKSYDDFI